MAKQPHWTRQIMIVNANDSTRRLYRQRMVPELSAVKVLPGSKWPLLCYYWGRSGPICMGKQTKKVLQGYVKEWPRTGPGYWHPLDLCLLWTNLTGGAQCCGKASIKHCVGFDKSMDTATLPQHIKSTSYWIGLWIMCVFTAQHLPVTHKWSFWVSNSLNPLLRHQVCGRLVVKISTAGSRPLNSN